MIDKTYYLTYVVGERGVGKTTLLAHFATEYMLPPRSIEDLQVCKKEIDKLRLGGWNNLSLEVHVKHLVYVVEETFIAKGLGYKPRISMELQFDKIGLYDGKHEVAYLLPYAKIFMPEIQSKLDSRKSMTSERVADYFLRYIERQRKVGVQMWADTQIDDSADKRFRSLADKLIEVQYKEDFYDKSGSLLKIIWTCLEFAGVRPYQRYKDTGSLSEAVKTQYTHIGNIYECVDSFSGKEYFYYGMKDNFHTKLAAPTSNSKADMLAKCERYPLFKQDNEKELNIWKN
ncbi:MAG: hypothetical protein LBN07_04895 [Christensenellaceae bacterium]|jgi:hypothetical protein|nr:hypothetical protein [Christensenellaceae bacterium]